MAIGTDREISTRFSAGDEAERNVILNTAVVRKLRSLENSGAVRFERDVTCLVGKNESGKTAFLEALHRANPFGGPGRGFDELRDYPRRLRGRDRPRSPPRPRSRPPRSARRSSAAGARTRS